MNIQTITGLMRFYFTRRILAEKTQQQYESVVRVFGRDVSDQIADLNEDILFVWRDMIIERASGTTFNNYLRHLRTLFNYGVKRERVSENLFSLIEMAPRYKKRPNTITKTQYNKMIAFLRCSNEFEPAWFWVAVVEFMALTGVRGRQVIELKWRDIDFQRSTIRLRVEGSKTRKEWSIPLPDSIGDTLYKWYYEQGVYKSAVLTESQVFNVTRHYPRYFGREMSITQLNDFFSRLSGRIGFRVGCRRLRHSLATHMANYSDVGDGYIFALKDLLGHSDIRTTQIYVSGNVERVRKMMNDSGISSGHSQRNKLYQVDDNKKTDKL